MHIVQRTAKRVFRWRWTSTNIFNLKNKIDMHVLFCIRARGNEGIMVPCAVRHKCPWSCCWAVALHSPVCWLLVGDPEQNGSTWAAELQCLKKQPLPMTPRWCWHNSSCPICWWLLGLAGSRLSRCYGCFSYFFCLLQQHSHSVLQPHLSWKSIFNVL